MTGFESVRRSLMEHAVINFILGPNSPKSRLIDVSCHETDDCDVFLQRLPSGMGGLGDRSGGRFDK